MFQTIADVLSFASGKGVLFLRHAKYEMRHAIAACAGDTNLAYARNYSRQFPDSFFPLNDDGIVITKVQGSTLAKMGIMPAEIVTSKNGRGPHTAVVLAQGIAERPSFASTPGDPRDLNVSVSATFQAETLLPIRHHPGVDYPVYNEEVLLRLLRAGQEAVMVQQWLNGQHPDLCQETSQDFGARSLALARELAGLDQFTVVVGHYELITFLHAFFVDREQLGTVREDWSPKYNYGVFIAQAPAGLLGFDVDADLKMVKSVNPRLFLG